MKRSSIVFIFFAFCIALALSSCEQECRHDNISELTVASTCTENGETKYTCLDCGYTYLDSIIEPTGHTFKKETVDADCTHDGYTEYTCDCGYSYISDIISAVGHEYEDVLTSPDCVNEGYTTHTCIKCNYSYVSNHIDPKGHSFTVSENDPTCEHEGVSIYTCDCGYSYTIVTSAPFGHELKESVTAPSCTEEGYTSYSCHCGFSYVADLVPPTGHDFSREVNMPTLSDMGYSVFDCQNQGCDFEYTGELKFYSDILSSAYAGNSEVLAKGIDISHHNYKSNADGYITLDWEAIKAAGVEFVIIRVGDAAIGIDPTFEKSYADAKAAGLDVGAYFYTRARSVSEIRREANLVLSALRGKQFEYPIYLDLEDDSMKGLDSALLNEMCIEFFTVLQRSGYYTGLYLNRDWLTSVVDSNTALSRFEIWYARYPSVSEGEQLSWKVQDDGDHLGMWQYSDKGIIEGVDTVFDLNFAYKNYPEIIMTGGFNGYESDAKFYDSEKAFVWITYDGSVKIRSKSDFFTADEYDSDLDVIGYAKQYERYEVIDITEQYAIIDFKGITGYISVNPAYVSFTGIYP